jgi:hypothetical protein
MLDWIYRVKRKAWADAAVMNDLLTALHDIFDPPGHDVLGLRRRHFIHNYQASRVPQGANLENSVTENAEGLGLGGTEAPNHEEKEAIGFEGRHAG